MRVFGFGNKILLFVLVALLFLGCGYQPSSKYARMVVGEKISTSVVISAQDPENTVVIKDAVDEAIIEIFHASLTTRTLSDTHLILSIGEPSYSATQYDGNGYIVGYRANLSLNIKRYKNGTIKNYSAKGTYDFSVSPNAVITDKQRFDAIKYSAEKAINAFIAQVSAEGARESKEKE